MEARQGTNVRDVLGESFVREAGSNPRDDGSRGWCTQIADIEDRQGAGCRSNVGHGRAMVTATTGQTAKPELATGMRIVPLLGISWILGIVAPAR